MPTEPLDIVWTAIFGWKETLRLCLIIVVAATAMMFFHLVGEPILPVIMR